MLFLSIKIYWPIVFGIHYAHCVNYVKDLYNNFEWSNA